MPAASELGQNGMCSEANSGPTGTAGSGEGILTVILPREFGMQNIGAAWLYPIILIAGALQAWGPPMNNALRSSLENPWLASLVSFLPIVALLGCILICLPHPVPSQKGLAEMPRWAPLGGLVGAFAVIAGLLFVGKVGAGAFAGLTITANILMSLADRFGLFGMEVHELSIGRMAGAALMIAGIALISKF
jgi:transporter family-2 protein